MFGSYHSRGSQDAQGAWRADPAHGTRLVHAPPRNERARRWPGPRKTRRARAAQGAVRWRTVMRASKAHRSFGTSWSFKRLSAVSSLISVTFTRGEPSSSM